MPKATPKTTECEKSERLRLAEAINNFTKKQDAFLDAYEELSEYKEDIFKDLDLKIEAKQEELKELTKKYKTRETDLKIECDQNFREYEYQKAKEVLEDRDEMAIEKEELEELRDELQQLKDDYKSDLEEALTEERSKLKKEMEYAINNCSLKHKAEIAETKAIAKQKEGEVFLLQETIENLKGEIKEQRKLTQAVAEASKQGAISQNFSK